MQNVKLLIVDDDEDDYLLAKDLIEDIAGDDCQLDWASTFDEGQDMLARNCHDLCLMDYKLGARDGIELLRQAQELGYTGPVILLTGLDQGEVDMRALQAGAVDYLVKASLSAEQLARSIRYALARREVELERVERLKAEAQNRSKSEFLAHLSHELRTPLSAILGFTELLINTQSDGDSLGHLRVVHRNGKHLLGLLNDILDLSKIEAGKLELEPQPVYLSSFLTDVYFLMHGAAVDKNLALRIDAPEPLPRQIETDPTRLRQVLLNLMGNAIKFTDSGEVVLRVSQCTESGQERLRFSVEDSGIGIGPDALESIFKPFVQSGDSYAEPRAGTGLGLAISRQLVNRLGGDINVFSEPGEGSEFTFTLDPGQLEGIERDRFSLKMDAPHEVPSTVPRLSGRVLVVDDLRDIRSLIGHFVQMTGLDVSYAKNGLEALRLMESEQQVGRRPFDLVLMDIHMPVMGGHEAASVIREQGFTQPLVALTAAHMKGDTDSCLDAGFTAYLSKPVDQHQVHTCLAQFLPPDDGDKTSERGESGRLLLVEDDPDAARATASLLELLGWTVQTVGDATEAIAAVQTDCPDVLLVDLHLPDMDGYTLASRLRPIAPRARVIVASGAEIDRERADRAGISASLLKPISLDQLREALEH